MIGTLWLQILGDRKYSSYETPAQGILWKVISFSTKGSVTEQFCNENAIIERK